MNKGVVKKLMVQKFIKTVEVINGWPFDGRSTVFATVDKRGAQPILGTTAEV